MDVDEEGRGELEYAVFLLPNDDVGFSIAKSTRISEFGMHEQK